MHPAFSVIFFTVSSGLGYGLLAFLGVLGAFGLLPADRAFGLTGIGLALVAVTAGLLSSTFHLGHPERAWRAFSQWRTSWLSREGVASVVTYGPACLFAVAWGWPDTFGALTTVSGLATAAMALVTIYCTAMIYRSLKTIPEWANSWTVINYIVLGLASGAVWLAGLLALFGQAIDGLHAGTAVLLLLAWGCKLLYWRHIDTATPASTRETATGLGKFGTVTPFEGPHTEDNYLLKEMGYGIARKHAAKLRIYTQIFAFLIPSILIGGAYVSGVSMGLLDVCAAVSIAFGLVIERWLVFAQAKHVVTLFYADRPT